MRRRHAHAQDDRKDLPCRCRGIDEGRVNKTIKRYWGEKERDPSGSKGAGGVTGYRLAGARKSLHPGDSGAVMPSRPSADTGRVAYNTMRTWRPGCYSCLFGRQPESSYTCNTRSRCHKGRDLSILRIPIRRLWDVVAGPLRLYPLTCRIVRVERHAGFLFPLRVTFGALCGALKRTRFCPCLLQPK